MGAIFLQMGRKIAAENVLGVFRRKGFADPIEIPSGDTTVFYFPKQLARYKGIAENSGTTIIASGTCFYDGYPPDESLSCILKEWKEGSFATAKLHGNFLLLILEPDRISLCTDRIGQYSVYFHRESCTLSSSFLATVTAAASRHKLSLNRTNITEVLLTGTGYGHETMVTGVNRLLPDNEEEVDFINVIHQNEVSSGQAKDDPSIEKQISVLNSIFEMYNMLFKSTGVISGLTGGLDSRLLLFLLRKHPSRLISFTNTYDTESLEYTCAVELAAASGIEHRSYVTKKPWEMDSFEYHEMIKDGFFFWDGVPRIHHLWTEERKSRSHLMNVYDNCTSGVSGVGGERFRIHNGMVSCRYPVGSWIEHEVLQNICGRCLLTTEEGCGFRAEFHKKVSSLAEVDSKDRFITLDRIRRFYDVVYNISNRTYRSSVENQLVFFLSPFVEPGISAVNTAFIRKNRSFELDLISRLAPELSHVKTSYGFSPIDAGVHKDAILHLLKGRTLFGMFHSMKRRIRKQTGLLSGMLLIKHAFLKEYVFRVKDLGLPIDIDLIMKNDSLFPVLLQTGMFLEEMEEFLRVD